MKFLVLLVCSAALALAEEAKTAESEVSLQAKKQDKRGVYSGYSGVGGYPGSGVGYDSTLGGLAGGYNSLGGLGYNSGLAGQYNPGLSGAYNPSLGYTGGLGYNTAGLGYNTIGQGYNTAGLGYNTAGLGYNSGLGYTSGLGASVYSSPASVYGSPYIPRVAGLNGYTGYSGSGYYNGGYNSGSYPYSRSYSRYNSYPSYSGVGAGAGYSYGPGISGTIV